MYCKKIAEILSAIFLYINSPFKLEVYLVKVPTQIRSFVRKTPHQIGGKFIFLLPTQFRRAFFYALKNFTIYFS